MTSAEASACLGRYQRAHPGAWDRLRQVIEKAAGHPVDQLSGTRPDLARALEFHDRWLPGTIRRITDITGKCMPQCVLLRGPGDRAARPGYR